MLWPLRSPVLEHLFERAARPVDDLSRGDAVDHLLVQLLDRLLRRLVWLRVGRHATEARLGVEYARATGTTRNESGKFVCGWLPPSSHSWIRQTDRQFGRKSHSKQLGIR